MILYPEIMRRYLVPTRYQKEMSRILETEKVPPDQADSEIRRLLGVFKTRFDLN